jgi:hypothetical protein
MSNSNDKGLISPKEDDRKKGEITNPPKKKNDIIKPSEDDRKKGEIVKKK